ncbi:unnamed protein product [Mytilus coruscus]|uniref:Reverse transcriptase domain-containing protein n=1 Tax=Mytilus coruscus TaxID=42192 RepID=A0A6J8A5U3_MYTCO|nr:unnamed protein product [Mytilus coruscus]
MQVQKIRKNLSTGDLRPSKITTRSYTLDRESAIHKKINTCQKEHLRFELKPGKNFVIELSTGAYETVKIVILNILQRPEITETLVTLPIQEGIEKSGLTVDSCYKVFNKKLNGDAGSLLKFTINLYHTTFKINVNGSRIDLFINNIFFKICEKLRFEYRDINILNNSIHSYLSQLKSSSSNTIHRTIKQEENKKENQIKEIISEEEYVSSIKLDDSGRSEYKHEYKGTPFSSQQPKRMASGGNPLKNNRQRTCDKNINIITCNIEGLKTNIAYMHTLDLSKTILCLQEHFLWNFQKKEIKILFPKMDDHTRCYDTNDPLDSFKLPKGRGGVSVLWPSQRSSRIKKLKEGNERIIAILITATKDICLINTYMPTHNSDSLSEYTECLDIIYDIIQKYENTHKIVLAGDLNGTLQTSRTNKHDKMLRNFAKNMNLTTGVELVYTHTFFHHAGNSSSQIDNILVLDENLVDDYTIEEKSCANTSAHTIVKMEIACQMTKIRKSNQQNNKSKYKMQWDQIDKKSYNSILQNSISSIENEKDVNIQLDMLMEAMTTAGKKTIPTKLLQTKGPKWKASPEVLTILKACKEIYKKWQSVGKTKDHVLASDLKNEKKKLRSKLRAEQALDRQKLYQQIIDNPNTQLFYRLINRGRNNNRTTTNCFKIIGEYMFLPEEQRKGFAQYYEDLSIPKEEQYDCNYLNLCKIRQSCIQEALQECTDIPELFTESEIEKAIDCLNIKKSPDEYGLSAEHLKNAKEIVTPALKSIFNNILLYRKVPTSFKSGILTPVLKKDKDSTELGNYRGITVTPVTGKTFEYSFLTKLNLESKADLQFGFRKGLSPIMASLIISEASTPFNIKQGVRQAGILSTHLYKVFVQDLLVELEENALGYHLGNVFAGTPTCADDIAFISNNENELQIMLNVLSRYANEHHYTIHPMKTQIIDCSKTKSNYKWN